MPTALSMPEIIHDISMRASESDVPIRECMLKSFIDEGLNKNEAKGEAKRLFKTTLTSIDDHLRTYPLKHLKYYFQRSSSSPHRAVPAPDAKKFRWTAEIQEAMMRLTPRDFEILVGNVFSRRGFAEVAVTPLSRDGGFDYVARRDPSTLAIGENSTPRILPDQNWYIFGQAKKYSLHNPVEVEQVHSLIGAIHTLNQGGGTPTIDRLKGKLEDWGWKQNSALTPSFATSGRFRSSIPGLAARQNWGVLDGEQMAQNIISLSRTIRTANDANALVKRMSQTSLSTVTFLQ